MPTPKFHVGDVVTIPTANLDWMEEPSNTRFVVLKVEDRVEIIPELKRQNDPHRYDKLHLETLDGAEPNLLHGPTVFALWCQLDPFLTAANQAILEGEGDVQDNQNDNKTTVTDSD